MNTFKNKIAAFFESKAGNYFTLILLCLSLAPIIVNIFLNLSDVIRTETFAGPFKLEVADRKAYIIHLNKDSKLRKIISSGGDTLDNPKYSKININLNEKPLKKPHEIHENIRNGINKQGAYSHWGDIVVFSLPDGISNAPGITIDVQYNLSIRSSVLNRSIVIFLLSIFILLWVKQKKSPDGFVMLSDNWCQYFANASYGLYTFTLLLSSIYFLISIFGYLDGYHIPTTAIFHILPVTEKLSYIEPSIPHILLVYAMIGIVFSWYAFYTNHSKVIIEKLENNSIQFFARYGLFIISALFIFSLSGTLAGIPRVEDLSINAIGGLIPFNDATGHFVQTFYQATYGNYESFASRRPLAATLRSSGMFLTGFSNGLFLLLQTFLISVATYFSTKAVIRWRGIWSGYVYFALIYILIRPYIPTNLTEPLGILLSLVSIPYIIYSLRTKSVFSRSVAFLFGFWSLIVRMGNMFYIPFFYLWSIYSLWTVKSARNKALIFLSFIGIFVITLNNSLSTLYGSGSGSTGSNFSYTLCGLAHNGDWTHCVDLYSNELAKYGTDEISRTKFLYAKGVEKIISDPTIVIGRMFSGMVGFIEEFSRITIKGYSGSIPSSFPTFIFFVFLIVGLIKYFKEYSDKMENAFWIFFIISLLAAAGVVYYDDGKRVLAASIPITSLFLSLGFFSPIHKDIKIYHETSLRNNNIIGFIIAATVSIFCVFIPWISNYADVLDVNNIKKIKLDKNEYVYYSSKYMSGFLVLPDKEPLRKDIPSISFKKFKRLVDISGVEEYENLISYDEKLKPLIPPFGIVAAPGMVENGGTLLIVPVDVLENTDAIGWRIKITSGKYWKRADSAFPVEFIK